MSRVLLTASAVFLVVCGAALTFASDELAAAAGLDGDSALPLQLLAGALLGMGVINWFSRGRPFGGIYGRPLGLGNVLLFVVGGFALGRKALATEAPAVWSVFVVYLIFAVGFVWVVFVGPGVRSEGAE